MERAYSLENKKHTPVETHTTEPKNIAEASPRYLAGVTTSALVLTCFGAIWGLQGPRIMIVITPVVTIMLLALCLATRQVVRRLPQVQEAPEEQAQGRKISRRFGSVVVGEFAAIAAAVVLLRLFNHPEYSAPVICLIVGLHFLPLASLFGVRVYVLVGAALSLLGSGALLALLVGLTFGDHWIWSVIVGLGSAGILWLAALFILIGVNTLVARGRLA